MAVRCRAVCGAKDRAGLPEKFRLVEQSRIARGKRRGRDAQLHVGAHPPQPPRVGNERFELAIVDCALCNQHARADTQDEGFTPDRLGQKHADPGDRHIDLRATCSGRACAFRIGFTQDDAGVRAAETERCVQCEIDFFRRRGGGEIDRGELDVFAPAVCGWRYSAIAHRHRRIAPVQSARAAQRVAEMALKAYDRNGG